MWQFVVFYRRPEDADAFVRDYESTHMPLVRHFPGLRRVTISRLDADEGSTRDDVFLMTTMYWDDRVSLHKALRSSERAAAYADTARFRHYQIGRYIGEVIEVSSRANRISRP